mmetsp:Transcript_21327/g.24786  ORF Transcript_21327/g.24786 Transcript_21327/m.24786 type:complete len:238 (+) Transcript_21327:40-753(+)
MGDEEKPYTLIKESGETTNNSREFTGRGTAIYPPEEEKNEIYEGDFFDGRRKGKGKYFYKNGDVYDGDWVDNMKHGFGKLTYKDKGEYYGFFENGRRHGEGQMNYPNGDTYSGWWKYGKKEGKGAYVYAATGMKLEGNWKDGKMTDGKWTLPNGVIYEGNFEFNKPIGEGVWHLKNGNKLRGVYKQKVERDENGNVVLPQDEEEGTWPPKGPKVDSEWISETKLAESAELINCHLNV